MNYAVNRIDKEENQSLCTMSCDTVAEKKVFFNAVQNPSSKVSDYINQEIVIKDIFMEKAFYEDGNGGMTEGVKTIIITPDGSGILANSTGIAKSIFALFDIFGAPAEWDEPITCIVRQVETPNGRYFKLEVK